MFAKLLKNCIVIYGNSQGGLRGARRRTGGGGDAGSSAGVPGVVQPLPALHNKAVKFGEVEEGQSCDLYAEGVFAHTYEKVHPQDAGGTKINAILVGEPQLEG